MFDAQPTDAGGYGVQRSVPIRLVASPASSATGDPRDMAIRGTQHFAVLVKRADESSPWNMKTCSACDRFQLRRQRRRKAWGVSPTSDRQSSHQAAEAATDT
ncbi:hypothetical protein Pla52n_33580 [Stieleria varia]|uniref:Uncharacterized protein n=1 Tax=Stieleria varia TaxID=2528005 RepID=A0A5C6ARV6_9BACT|nr:hypothetical protein Pla52n_33580 [Stieleria varia]